MSLVFVLERPTQFDAPLFRLAAADPNLGFEAWFAAADADAPVEDPELGRAVDWGIDLVSGYRSSVVPSRHRARWLSERFRRARPRLVVINGYTRRVYLDVLRAARQAGVRTALRIDSALFPGDPPPSRPRRILVAALERRFVRFLATGRVASDFLLACGVTPGRIGRFPYAVDHAAMARGAAAARAERGSLRARWGLPPEARVVLSLTKFSPREAPWDALAARAALDRPDLWWVLAGDGPERDALERAIASRGLERIVLPGYLPYPELPAAYAVADLFVHPAREERWGVSVAEALACGLPVVASHRVGAAYDLVEPGENGALYPSGDGAALAREVEAALALDPARVAAASAPRLAEFGLEATWQGLVQMAEGTLAGVVMA
jgi:glycosyltransferase involved in cell wall biosynthesis